MNNCFVIAEAGVNHNGSIELACELVKEAHQAGADAVKFQTFKADKLVCKGAEKAEYQKKQTGDGDQFSMLKQLEMTPEMHSILLTLCNELGIEFMSTGFDENSLDYLVELGIKRIKIPSGELTNYPLIRHAVSKNIPLILSTGMATLKEVEDAVSVINEERVRLGFNEPLSQNLTILHCTSNYPASPEDVNLNAMKSMESALRIPVGYSDHTLGVAVSTAAVGMGAVMIEKHFTICRSLDGPDHAASLEPHELKVLIDNIRIVSAALGSDIKAPTKSELPVRDLVRKSIAAARDLDAGETITLLDVVMLRPGTGIPPSDVNSIVGLVVKKKILQGKLIQKQDLCNA